MKQSDPSYDVEKVSIFQVQELKNYYMYITLNLLDRCWVQDFSKLSKE